MELLHVSHKVIGGRGQWPPTGDILNKKLNVKHNMRMLMGGKETLEKAPMRTAILRPVIATAMAVLAFSSLGTGVSSAEPSPSDNVSVAFDQAGKVRSAVPTEVGLKLNTAEGDSVNIANNVASWRDQAGNTMASIDLDNEGNQDTEFRYDEATQTIMAESASEKFNPDGVMSLAASGVATPIGGIVTAAACEAAGGAMVTAVSC